MLAALIHYAFVREIHEFAVKDGKVSLRCSAAARIYFIGGSGGRGGIADVQMMVRQ